MLSSTRFSVRILDLYFDEVAPTPLSADILRCNQFSKPVDGLACAPVYTWLLDLSPQPDEIFSKVKSHTRSKIRRAEKDGLVCAFSDGKNGSDITRFADFYDRQAELKKLIKVSRRRLEILAERDALDLSFISDGSGQLLVANSFFKTHTRARGLQLAVGFRDTSDPARRSLIGRANRYLRWRDILRFREMGMTALDFGGWYSGKTDEQLLRVNEFKAEFPGRVALEFSGQKALTWKGKMGLNLLESKDLWRRRSAAGASATLEPRVGIES